MSMRQMMQWIYQAPANERAEAAALLAKSYLAGDGSAEDRRASEATLTVLLDDTSPQVRKALAAALAASPKAPHHIILALAQDQGDIAAIIMQHSPLLMDAELVDMIARGQARVQVAIAQRRGVSVSVSAAIAEVGSAEACAALLGNESAQMAIFSIARMAERLGSDAIVREALLERDDLPVAIRQQLLTHLSNVLSNFLTQSGWLRRERAFDVTREAVDRATLVLADLSDMKALSSLVTHLAESGQLTSVLLFRAVCAGNTAFFDEALVQLSRLPRERVYAMVQDRGTSAFQGLFKRAGLPESAFPAFRAALDVLSEHDMEDRPLGQVQFSREMLQRVLQRYLAYGPDESDHLLLLLRRFSAEAAREEARRYAVDHIQGFATIRRNIKRRAA